MPLLFPCVSAGCLKGFVYIGFILYLAELRNQCISKTKKVISITSEMIYQSLVIAISLYFHSSVFLDNL